MARAKWKTVPIVDLFAGPGGPRTRPGRARVGLAFPFSMGSKTVVVESNALKKALGGVRGGRMRKVQVGSVVVRVAESRRKRLSELRGLLAPRKGAVEAVRALREGGTHTKPGSAGIGWHLMRIRIRCRDKMGPYGNRWKSMMFSGFYLPHQWQIIWTRKHCSADYAGPSNHC